MIGAIARWWVFAAGMMTGLAFALAIMTWVLTREQHQGRPQGQVEVPPKVRTLRSPIRLRQQDAPTRPTEVIHRECTCTWTGATQGQGNRITTPTCPVHGSPQ